MKKNIWILIFVMLGTMLIFAGCGGNGSPADDAQDDQIYNLSLSGMFAADHPYTKGLEDAVAKIAERTDGKVNITVYPANQLGDYTDVYEEIMMGTIDMGQVGITGEFDPRLEINSVAYMFTTYDECKKHLANDSGFFSLMDGYMVESGVKTLGLFADGFVGLGGTYFDLDTIMDFTVKKDELIRIAPYETYRILTEDMGFRTTSITYAELYPALQTGVADGWIGGGALLNYTDFRDVIKYYVDMRSNVNLLVLCINDKLFESMPAEYQQVLTDVFNELCIEQVTALEAETNDYLQKLEEYGITVYVPTDEELTAAAEYIRTNTWPKFEEMLGSDTMADLKTALGIE